MLALALSVSSGVARNSGWWTVTICARRAGAIASSRFFTAMSVLLARRRAAGRRIIAGRSFDVGIGGSRQELLLHSQQRLVG